MTNLAVGKAIYVWIIEIKNCFITLLENFGAEFKFGCAVEIFV